MSDRPKLGALFTGAEEPAPRRSDALRNLRQGSPPLRAAAAPVSAPVTPSPVEDASPGNTPLSQQPSLTMSMDMPTYRLMRAHSDVTGEPAPAILNAALSDEAVMAKVNAQWGAAAVIPGMRSTRRRPPEGTKTVQFKIGSAGRAFVSDLAAKAHAPSVSAFISLAIHLHLNAVNGEGADQAG